jgi:hypothetical protein
VDVAALILWILTAAGGYVLLATWLSKGGADSAGSNFPSALVFGHLLLATAGLLLWIIYVATSRTGVGWLAFAVLALVALLGFTMFARWLPNFRGAGRHGAGDSTAGTGSGTAGAPVATMTTAIAEPAERHFPVPVVAGHGLLAAATLVLVLLTMLA